MKIRLYVTTALACLAIAMGSAAGCGSKSSPIGPTVIPPTVTSLAVKGNAALTAPGQTTQLSLEATLSDGSKKDVTSTAQWRSTAPNVVTVSTTGLATAVDFGKANVQGFAASRTSSDLVVTVLPQGTY